MEPLTPTERRALRAKAHPLHPYRHRRPHGLTPAVASEIDLALAKHELIKVRVLGDDGMPAKPCSTGLARPWIAPRPTHGQGTGSWRPNPELAKKPARPCKAHSSARHQGRREASESAEEGHARSSRPDCANQAWDAGGCAADWQGDARCRTLQRAAEGAPLPSRDSPPPRRRRTGDDAPKASASPPTRAKTKPRSFSAKPESARSLRPRNHPRRRQTGERRAAAEAQSLTL